VGLGGLTLPAVTALTAGVLPWWSAMLGGAVLAAAVAAASLAIAMPVSSADATAPRGSIAAVMRQPGLVWIALLVMLGAGNEASMAGFTSTYLTALGFEPQSATWALSAHWVGLIVGRIAFGGFLDRGKARAIILAGTGSAAAMTVMVTVSAA
jgi:predicted MFS family arabinose efflux permease